MPAMYTSRIYARVCTSLWYTSRTVFVGVPPGPDHRMHGSVTPLLRCVHVSVYHFVTFDGVVDGCWDGRR